MSTSSIFRSASLGAFLLASSSLLSRFLGLARDALFSALFGVGNQEGIYAVDAYYLAFKIPDFIYTLLIFGALSAAFIPLYTDLRLKKDQEEASRFTSQVLRKVLFLLLFTSSVSWLLAPWILPLLAPGFPPELQTLAIDLTRIMLLSPLFLGLSSLFQGIENAHKSFWGISLAPLVYNTALIAVAYFWGNDYGVYALAWGVALGAFLHFLVQIPGIRHTPFRWSWKPPEEAKAWKDFIKMAVPRIVGSSALQISIIADAFLTTFLPLGSLAIYTYAFNLQSLPYGVVAVAISTAVFTTLSEQNEDPKAFVQTLKESLNTILFWVLPAVLGLYLLREPIIHLILERGAFEPQDTVATAQMLSIFVWAALPQSLIPLFSRAFYSLKETWIPVKIAIFSIGMGLTVSLYGLFILEEGLQSLAWGNLIASSLNAFLLIIFLQKRLKASWGDFWEGKALFRIGLALSAMTFVLHVLAAQTVLLLIPVAGLTYLLVGTPLKRLAPKLWS